VKIETYPDRASWLAARGKGIGGSDVAAILGLSPWNAPLSLWMKKVGAIPSDFAASDEFLIHVERHGLISFLRQLQNGAGREREHLAHGQFARAELHGDVHLDV
jgi:hypothetical protein